MSLIKKLRRGSTDESTDTEKQDRSGPIELCGKDRAESLSSNWCVDDGIVYAESGDGDVATAGVIIANNGVGIGISLDDQSVNHLGVLGVFDPDDAREIADAIYRVADHVEDRE